MTLFIDPVTQVLMDFYLEAWAAKEEGKTYVIDYEKWTQKIKKTLHAK